MARPTRLVVDCSTGVKTIEEYTDEEMAQLEIDTARYAEEQAQKEAEAEAKALAKASALAKLAELGLTEEEAAALIS